VFTVLFGILLSYSLIRRRILVSQFVIGGALALVLLLALGTYRMTVRGFVEQGSGMSSETWSGAKAAVDSTVSGGPIDSRLSALFTRLADGVYIAGIIQSVPSNLPFQNGDSYYKLLYVLIPRALYPDKPVMNMDVTPILFPGAGGSAPVTVVGEGYLNFGWIGIMGAMTAVGALSGLVERAFLRYSTTCGTFMSFLYLSVSMVRSFTQPLAGWVAFFVEMGVIAMGIMLFERALGVRSASGRRRRFRSPLANLPGYRRRTTGGQTASGTQLAPEK
jgi:hypothetical protein